MVLDVKVLLRRCTFILKNVILTHSLSITLVKSNGKKICGTIKLYFIFIYSWFKIVQHLPAPCWSTLQLVEWLAERTSSTILREGKGRSYSLGKQPTFHYATCGFPTKWYLRNERKNSILLMGTTQICIELLVGWKFASSSEKHCSDLGSDTAAGMVK